MGSPEQSSAERKSEDADDAKTVEEASPSAKPDADGEWGAGGLSAADADELASKFRPSWESVDDEDSIDEPAGGNGADADANAWAAGGAAGAEAAAAHSAAPPSSPPAAEQPAKPTPAQVVHEPSVVVEPMASVPIHASPSADITGPTPAIPVGSSNRNMILGGVAALAVVLIVVVSLAMSGDAEPEAAWETESATATASAPSTASAIENEEAEAEAPAAAQPEATEPEASAEAELAAESDVAPESDVAAEAAEPAEPPPPAMAQLRLRTTPANATVTIAGERVDNPYRAEHPEGSALSLVVSAMGYQTHEGTVTLDQNRTLHIRLERAPRPRVAATQMTAPRTRPTQMRTTRARTTQMRVTQMRTTMRGAGFVTDNPY